MLLIRRTFKIMGKNLAYVLTKKWQIEEFCTSARKDFDRNNYWTKLKIQASGTSLANKKCENGKSIVKCTYINLAPKWNSYQSCFVSINYFPYNGHQQTIHIWQNVQWSGQHTSRILGRNSLYCVVYLELRSLSGLCSSA